MKRTHTHTHGHRHAHRRGEATENHRNWNCVRGAYFLLFFWSHRTHSFAQCEAHTYALCLRWRRERRGHGDRRCPVGPRFNHIRVSLLLYWIVCGAHANVFHLFHSSSTTQKFTVINVRRPRQQTNNNTAMPIRMNLMSVEYMLHLVG